MKLGINTLFISPFEFEEGLRFASEQGAEMIEVGTVPGPARKYCDLDTLVADKGAVDRWLETLKKYGYEISALATHGAMLSPNKEAEADYMVHFGKVCKLAEAAGVDRLTLNGGTPEGAEGETSEERQEEAEGSES